MNRLEDVTNEIRENIAALLGWIDVNKNDGITQVTRGQFDLLVDIVKDVLTLVDLQYYTSLTEEIGEQPESLLGLLVMPKDDHKGLTVGYGYLVLKEEGDHIWVQNDNGVTWGYWKEFFYQPDGYLTKVN